MNSKMHVVETSMGNPELIAGVKSREQSGKNPESSPFDKLLLELENDNPKSTVQTELNQIDSVKVNVDRLEIEEDQKTPLKQTETNSLITTGVKDNNAPQESSPKMEETAATKNLNARDQGKGLKNLVKNVVVNIKQPENHAELVGKKDDLESTEEDYFDILSASNQHLTPIHENSYLNKQANTDTSKLLRVPRQLQGTDALRAQEVLLRPVTSDVAAIKEALLQRDGIELKEIEKQTHVGKQILDTNAVPKKIELSNSPATHITISDNSKLSPNLSVLQDVVLSKAESKTKVLHRLNVDDSTREQENVTKQISNNDTADRQSIRGIGGDDKSSIKLSKSIDRSAKAINLDQNLKLATAPTLHIPKESNSQQLEKPDIVNQTEKYASEHMQNTKGLLSKEPPSIEKIINSITKSSQLEVSKQLTPLHSDRMKLKTSLLKHVESVHVEKATRKTSQINTPIPHPVQRAAENIGSKGTRQTHPDDIPLTKYESEPITIERQGFEETLKQTKQTHIKSENLPTVMGENSDLAQKNVSSNHSSSRVLSTVIHQKIQELLDQSITTKSNQTRFFVDGGKFGSLEIEFSVDEVKNSITIIVDSEINRNELQRITPQIYENISQKGMDISGLNVEVRDSKREKQTSGKAPKGETLSNNVSNQNPEKESIARNYGYNTMEVTA